MNSIPIRFRLSISVVFWLASGSFFVSAQELNWQTDLEQAIQLAEKEQKLILLHFTATWSKSCKDLETFVYSSPQVQRAIHSNVIPVRIDVDEQAELTSQYGIGKVPYDIVISPSKRIIVRRESPPDAVNYSAMIVKLERAIQAIAQKGSTTLDQNLDDFQQLMKKSDPISEHKSLTPDSQSHQAAQAPPDAQEMNRKHVTNWKHSASEIAQPAANLNVSTNPTASQSPTATSAIAKARQPGPLKIINPNFLANSDQSGSRPLTNATMQPNLQRPPAFVEPSVHDARPKTIAKAKFVANPTAVATEFKVDVPAEKDFAAINTTVKTPVSSVPLTNTTLQPTKSSAASLPANQGATATAKQPEHSIGRLLESAKSETEPAVESAVGLHGKCSVTLIREGRWVAGENQWGCVHRDRTYLFASKENLSTFLADPDAYSPLLAGFDPVVFERTGKLVSGLEEHGVFMGKAPNLRVVLFSDQETSREFKSNPKKYVMTIRNAMENSGGASSTVEH